MRTSIRQRIDRVGLTVGAVGHPDPLTERFYSPEEVAGLLGLDTTTARRMFRDVPGVVKLGRECRRDGKRDYVTLRIPESVLRRFLQERMQ